jgi:hypothetical protein
MVNREEYVEKMKAQLDQWSAQMAEWEAAARDAKAEAKTEWEKQVGILKSRIDDVAFKMELLKGASSEAWNEVARGAEEARKAMQVSFERARSKFDGI